MPRSTHPGTPGYEPGTEWKYEIDAAWESGELSSFNNTLDHSGANLQTGHTYRARVRMKDAAGRWSHWSAPVRVCGRAAGRCADARDSPSCTIIPTIRRWAMSRTRSSSKSRTSAIKPIDLSGVQITEFAETPYVFANGLSLQPGQYIVVARTPAVFTSIYGAGINLAPGGYGPANLSNTGETIAIRDADGGLLASLTYGDSNPWPTAPDGSGPSLQIIDSQGNGNDPGELARECR